MIARSAATGLAAAAILLAVFFGLVGLVSGLDYALDQFVTYWYFITGLSAGFGVQIGMYTYLKRIVQHRGPSGKVVAVSGATSTAAIGRLRSCRAAAPPIPWPTSLTSTG